MTSLRTIHRTLARLTVSCLFLNTLRAQPLKLPLEVDESKPGVSDVFASALWCADHLFSLADLGIADINFHGSFNCRGYTLFGALKDGGYHAHANYSGMLFFRQAAQISIIKPLLEIMNLKPSLLLIP